MGYVETIFMRMNLQQICAFILNGMENSDIENMSYNERLTTGSEAIYNQLKDLCNNESEFEKASANLSEALTVYEKVYTEIGMKAGAQIMSMLLQKDDFELLKNY